MKVLKWKKRFLAGILLALLIQAGFPGVSAEAAAGTVYTCTIHPSYRNPVTGEIEDSGGEASYATGQGMVEGAVYTTGILELTDTGEYYLTIRMSLMDYTSNHSFWVQNVGDSGWSTPALGVTGNGTDGNGTTSDICIQVPSENCVVRGAMYVEPMGRDVIFFLYPSDFAAGNSTDMNATMVTETSGSSSSQTSDSATAAAPSASSSSSLPSGNSQGSDSGETKESTGTEAEAEETQETQGAESEVQVLENTIEDPADTSQDTEEPSADETELNSAQGLSLSTAESSQEEEQTSAASSGTGAASQIMTLILAFTVSGLLLIGAAAGVVYYFRRNWRRWGGGEDDDE